MIRDIVRDHIQTQPGMFFIEILQVGHSFGGLVAAELCEMLPAGFVTTLILLAPAYFESERQARRMLTASHFPAAHVRPL